MEVTDEEIDAFLSHYGVPGMKWGVRKQASLERRAASAKGTAGEAKAQKKLAKKTSRNENWQANSGGKKAAVVLAGAGAAFVAANLVTAKTMNVNAGLAAGAGAGVAAGRFVNRKMDSAGKTKVASLPPLSSTPPKNKVVSEKEAIRQVEQFLKDNPDY